MKYYFEDQEKQKILKAELDEWLGTPFRHWAGVKGEGCDCIHLVVRVFEKMGLGPIKIDRYSKDWHIHNSKELLLSGMRRTMKGFVELPLDTEPMNGDVVLYKFGKTTSHSAIYFDKKVYQSITGIGVESRQWLDKKWHKRKVCIMRLRHG
jgi:cell wall-associated NlpC family hydrolase